MTTIIVESEIEGNTSMHMAKRDHALALAAEGFNVFPLEDGGKQPRIKNWPVLATCDAETVRSWWRKWPDANIGICTTGLLVVDVDVKGIHNGEDTLELLALTGDLVLPATRMHRTASGGRHLFYRSSVPIANGVHIVGPGVDIRGDNGYVVGPGSAIDGRAYSADSGVPIIEAPPELVARCKAARPKKTSTNKAPPAVVDQLAAEARAVRYLIEAEGTTLGAGSNDGTYKVVARVKDCGVALEAALELLLKHWNEKCNPPWPVDKLRTMVDHAYEYGQEEPGAAAPEVVYAEVMSADARGEEPALLPTPQWVADVNREWFLVDDHGAAVVCRFVHDYALGGRRRLERYTTKSFKELHENKYSARGQPLGADWMKHPRRREYLGGVTFAPGATVPSDTLNLWQGFGIEPIEGNWSLMREHIRDVVANGNSEHSDYLLNWLARAVQHPGEAGEVAIVMRGGKGTGKGCFARAVLLLFGQHGLHISNSEHLVGRFNGQLRDTVLLFADEAFYAGDKKHESVLKAHVTEPTIMIEGKFQNAVSAPNFLHILMASNDQWVVPAGGQERRFFVVDVSDRRQQDHSYFAAVEQQMKSGGLSAMLYDLQRRDLSRFNVRRVPQTDALADQKVHTLRGPTRWLRERLEERRISFWGDREMHHVDWDHGDLELPKQAVFDAYKQWSDKAKDEYRASRTMQFWKEIKAVFGSLRDTRLGGKDRKRMVAFPPIEQGRALFDAFLGGSAGWE